MALLASTSACQQSLFKADLDFTNAPAQATIHKTELTDTPNTPDQQTTSAYEPSDNSPNTLNKEPIAQNTINHITSIPEFEAPQETDIWHRIKEGMQLSGEENNPRVIEHITYYARHQDYIDRVTERARPFLFMIMEQIDKNKMPAEIALLPIVESAFQPFAYSHGRAAGIWQFIPGTGRMFGLKQNWWYDGRRDISASTTAALQYLESLHKRLDGDWLLALAAYNSGEGNVRRAIRKNRKKGLPTDFWHLDLPDETRAYVPKLLAISAIVSNPQQYNITLNPVHNEPAVVEVKTSAQIDLALVAKLADISIEEVYRLNPAFNRWATVPDKAASLLIPVEKESLYHERLASTPKDQFIEWKRHKIKPGETLSQIAQDYSTTVKLLSKINQTKSLQIRAGKYLMIPVAKQELSDYSLTRQQRSLSRLASNNNGHKSIIVVKNGDTFWDLSRQYKVSVRSLARWNGMAPADTLKPGKKLVLWTKTKSHSDQGASLTGSSLPAATIRTIHYTVRRGDSLALISDKFKVTIKQLLEWNRINQDQYLQPGQRLTLYVDVTRQT